MPTLKASGAAHPLGSLSASSAAQTWVPIVAIALVVGGLVAAVGVNRVLDRPISCSHEILPLITAVLENSTERLVALCAVLLAMPFNMAFAAGARAVWRELDSGDAGVSISDRAGPCACALGGWVLVGLIALNDRSLDPRHFLHNALVLGLVICEGVFLACSLRSLRCRMKSSSCPKRLLSARAGLLALRSSVMALGFVFIVVFIAMTIVGALGGSCEAYRRNALYAAVAEYMAIACLVAQYVGHAYEFHLLRASGIWAAACAQDQFDGVGTYHSNSNLQLERIRINLVELVHIQGDHRDNRTGGINPAGTYQGNSELFHIQGGPCGNQIGAQG